MSDRNKAISLVGLIILTLSLALLYQGISFSNNTLEQSIKTAEKSMNTTLLAIQELSFLPYSSRIKNFTEMYPDIIEGKRLLNPIYFSLEKSVSLRQPKKTSRGCQ